jgi:hypothetical protein
MVAMYRRVDQSAHNLTRYSALEVTKERIVP